MLNSNNSLTHFRDQFNCIKNGGAYNIIYKFVTDFPK